LISVAITAAVMLSTRPVVASIFARLSLETFWLNLIMVFLLGLLVLPSCPLSLFISALSLVNPPFGLQENSIFKLTELVVQGWFTVLEFLHNWGNWASFNRTLDWGPPKFILYYSVILFLEKILTDRFRKSV
jgi:hypothetical protein